MNKDTARGNTIKLEEFYKLPNSGIAMGLISDSKDGINIDNSGKLLYYIVVKYSNQDWCIYCLREETVKDMPSLEKQQFIINTGTKVQDETHIKRVFNCSKTVMELYTH